MIELYGQIKPQRLRGHLNVVPSEGGAGGPLQAKTAYPSHSEQIIAPDEDYYGLVSVTVKPVPRLPACEVKVMQIPSEVRYLNQRPLAEIPAEVLADYPYAVIVMASETDFWLWLSTEKMYVATVDGIDKLVIPANRIYYGFNADANAWLVQYAYTTPGGYNVNGDGGWAVWWANHDIHIGSADSGETYFPASQPQEVQPADATHYYYNGVRLPAIPEKVLSEYPYALVRKDNYYGYYDLALSKSVFYHNTDIHCADGDSAIQKWYQIPITTADSMTAWAFKEDTYGVWVINENRHMVWSNHDIPNGSATATDIYFHGTLAVPDPLQGGA